MNVDESLIHLIVYSKDFSTMFNSDPVSSFRVETLSLCLCHHHIVYFVM